MLRLALWHLGIIVSFVAAIIPLIRTTVEWSAVFRHYPCIRFRSFRQFYMLNPCRWEFYDAYVRYRGNNWDYEYFRFSYFETYRFKVFKLKVAAARRRAEQARALGVVAKCVQSDIDKTKKLAELELEKAKTIIEGVGKP